MRTVKKRSKCLVKPALVIDYNHTMGGVDQHLSDYPLPRNSGRPPAAQQLWRLIDRQFPDSLPLTENKCGPY
ncbi:hypothetical protein J437_LFUL008048 [Ladona fulva]|uniref:Uncharacterized protein n=1 Tax=Ladona fulva TaxID=123851 RepID=A0A8K0P4V7_LADFU|nr:hypothetical protein J437_LFUL008048 [Ladona fulva]